MLEILPSLQQGHESFQTTLIDEELLVDCACLFVKHNSPSILRFGDILLIIINFRTLIPHPIFNYQCYNVNLKMNQKQLKSYKIIQTTLGERIVQEIKIKCCFFHQNLTSFVYPQSIDKPLTFQNINMHRRAPLSLENTSVNQGMIEHQMQSVIAYRSLSLNQLIVCDGSPYDQKIPQIFSKMMIVRGYSYRPKFNSKTKEEQKISLLNFDYVLKQIQYEFKLGNNQFKPGFLGQVFLEDFTQNLSEDGVLQAYLSFSAETGCPIILNLNYPGQNALCSYLKNRDQNKSSIQRFKSKIQKLKSILTQCKNKSVNSFVVYNFPFVFQVSQTSIFNIFESELFQMILQNDISFGFDLLRYTQNNFTIHSMMTIARLIKNYSTKIILSSGIRYKTDLQSFSGEGLSQYYGNQSGEIEYTTAFNILKSLVLQNGGSGQDIGKVSLENKLKLLSWKIKTEQIKIEVMWKCNACSKQQSQSVESFRKFGFQFCSVKCLKSYKF